MLPAVLLFLSLALCGCIENPVAEDPIVEAGGPVSSYPAARIGPGGAEKDQWTAVTNWPELEAAGCVFLSSAEIGGHYWSATSLRSDGAEGISHGVAPVTSLGNINAGRQNAYLVRLVKDAPATP